MGDLKATIDDPEGGIIARFYETPNEKHDFEIQLVSENDRIHQVNVRRPITPSKIENEVMEFLESIDSPYADGDWTVEMS
ncbi:hypothetical protein RH831_10980 [Halodesulfurarchaeum sp. HSR-GB]|uniref:hypothetical protein n=1 Tax=Halodesulfurarchaeum sp. HSR-GB TaxID=3074077 RepID=UPI00285D3E5F|nr:hypothetical protein [Halodesulfurarchaeum sp. HSR-GB]MDR5657699.1 hypothetical protein [Halodesulfurarchaeum sp. HSR-GB]